MKGEISGVSLEVFDPTGAIEITELYAPRLADLSGKTICEANHRGWEGTRIFPYIREQLQKRVPDAKIVPYTEFPNIFEVQPGVLYRLLKEKGCEAAIVGNAA